METLKKECSGSQSSAAPYADMFYFRSRTALDLTAGEERHLTAALAAGDSQSALEFTQELRRDVNPLKRFTANLVALYVWGNSGKPLASREVQAIFARLEKDLDAAPPGAKADYFYLRSLAAHESGQHELALDYANKAVAEDGRFFNAHVLRLALLVDEAGRSMAPSSGKCEMESQLALPLEAIVAFSPCTLQSAHLARYLSSRQANPGEHMPLLVTELFLATISKQKSAFDAKAGQLTRLAEQNATCKPWIQEVIEDLKRQF